jgi:hypothetical protein
MRPLAQVQPGPLQSNAGHLHVRGRAREDGLRRLLKVYKGKSLEARQDTVLMLLLDTGARRGELVGPKLADCRSRPGRPPGARQGSPRACLAFWPPGGAGAGPLPARPRSSQACRPALALGWSPRAVHGVGGGEVSAGLWLGLGSLLGDDLDAPVDALVADVQLGRATLAVLRRRCRLLRDFKFAFACDGCLCLGRSRRGGDAARRLTSPTTCGCLPDAIQPHANGDRAMARSAQQPAAVAGDRDDAAGQPERRPATP